MTRILTKLRDGTRLALSSLVVALLLYCGGQAAHDGAVVTDAAAQSGDATCCATAPYQFDQLAAGTIDLTLTASSTVEVGDYREVVVYVDEVAREHPGCSGDGCCPSLLPAMFRANANAPFGSTGQAIRSGARVRVDGTALRLELGRDGINLCDRVEYQYVIAGVR